MTGVTALLGADEPAAVEVVNAEGRSSALLVCDHASNRVPRGLAGLGLTVAQLADHIGWDPGAAEVARRLAAELDAPLVLSGYSRLVIDCNRPLDNPQAIPEQSGGVAVPGNRALSPEERTMRIDALYRPYHRAIDRLLDARGRRPTVLLSIHSFTPVLDAHARPWPIGVSYWRDGRLAALLREALASGGELTVGDNQPYPIETHVDYTVPVHGEARGLPSVMVEIRQDGVRNAAGAAAWAERLAQAYRRIETRARHLCAP